MRCHSGRSLWTDCWPPNVSQVASQVGFFFSAPKSSLAPCPTQSCALSGGMEVFQAFLESEYSDENIEFWRVCEDYKKIKSSFRMCCKAKMIFKRYIQAEAVREVGRDQLSRPPLFFLSTSNRPVSSPPDQHRPQNKRRDPTEHQDAHHRVLRRCPKDRLQPHGERLLPTFPRVRLLLCSAKVHLGASENIIDPETEGSHRVQ